MIVLHIATLAGALLFAGGAPQQSPSAMSDTIPRFVAVEDDTVRKKRPVSVEYSEWYNRRLVVHKWASYTMIPLFVGNYITGDQLLKNGNQAPDWAINSHGALATGVATLFTVNTITGAWNLWDGRSDPSARKWRMTHAILLLAADAGFTATGILANEAERSDQRRRLHRTVALGSIATSVFGYAMMLSPFRRD